MCVWIYLRLFPHRAERGKEREDGNCDIFQLGRERERAVPFSTQHLSLFVASRSCETSSSSGELQCSVVVRTRMSGDDIHIVIVNCCFDLVPFSLGALQQSSLKGHCGAHIFPKGICGTVHTKSHFSLNFFSKEGGAVTLHQVVKHSMQRRSCIAAVQIDLAG